MHNFSQLDLFGDDNFTPELEESTKQLQATRSGTFTDNMRLPIHRWFRYSAGFSAEWVEQLIKDSPATGRLIVLDPFAGSGTTLLAAEKAGAVAYGYESHPFVYRIATAKLLWRLDERSFLNAATILLDRAKARMPQVPAQLPDLLAKCFTPKTLERLLALRDCYAEIGQEADEWKLETTPDIDFENTIKNIKVLTDQQRASLKQHLIRSNQELLDQFIKELEVTLDRKVNRVIVIPLHGNQSEFISIKAAVSFIQGYDETASPNGVFRQYEVIVRYSNGDKIEAIFKDKQQTLSFLNYVSGTTVRTEMTRISSSR